MEDALGEIAPFETTTETATAPAGLLYGAAVLLVLSAILIPISGGVAHLTGYLLAAIGVPLLVIWFRTLTRQREWQPLYVKRSRLSVLAASVLVAAVVVAVLHGFFYSRSTVLA